MALATRDSCLSGPHLPPYLNRAFTQNTHFPQYGLGGNSGLEQWVNTESALTIPYMTRVRNGCSDSLEIHPDLSFDFLPTKWQQPDFRPIHFTESTRQAVKDGCNSRGDMYGNSGNNYLGCLPKRQPMFYQESPELMSVFEDRYV